MMRLKIEATALLILAFATLSAASMDQFKALTECVPCIQGEGNKFCTDGKSYECCKKYEMKGLCNSTSKAITCSNGK